MCKTGNLPSSTKQLVDIVDIRDAEFENELVQVNYFAKRNGFNRTL